MKGLHFEFPDAERSKLSSVAGTIERELSRLPSSTEGIVRLRATFTELMGLLTLPPSDEARLNLLYRDLGGEA